MAFTPEPTHPFDEQTLPAQLNREFWALRDNDQILKDYINGALPVKAFNMILDGAGVVADPNDPVPVIRPVGFYNIDFDFGTNGVERTALGVYRFQMRFAQISGVDILLATFPQLTYHVNFPTNAVTRAGPTRTSFDQSFQLTVIDSALGLFEVTTEHIFSTGGGVLSVEPVDMQPLDVLFAAGTLSLGGNAGDYPDTP